MHTDSKQPKRRSTKVQLLLFILGFITAGVGWIALVIYRLMRPVHRRDDKDAS